MKGTHLFLIGYFIVVGGILAALWKLGVLADVGTTWTLIGAVIAIGIGIMLAVSNSANKNSV